MPSLLTLLLFLAATGDGYPEPRTDIIGTWEVRTTPTHIAICGTTPKPDIYNWVLDVADRQVEVEVMSTTAFKHMRAPFEGDRLVLVGEAKDGARAFYDIQFNKAGTKFTGRRGWAYQGCYAEWSATGRKL